MNKIKHLYIIVLLTIFSKNTLSMQQAESQYQENEYAQDSILLNLPDELIISVINQLVIPQVKDIFNNWENIFQDPKIDLVILKSLSNSSSKLHNLIKYILKSNSLRDYLNKIKQEKFDILLENLRTNSQVKYKDLNQNKLNKKLRKILNGNDTKNNLINAVELTLAGADINTTNQSGKTTFKYALEKGYKEIVEILLQASADVIAMDNNEFTALMFASYNGLKYKVEVLIKKGADVNATDKWGQTALMNASASGHKEIVQILIDKGADVNATGPWGRTALMAACANNNFKIIKMLIQAKASIKIKDNTGNTALTIMLRKIINRNITPRRNFIMIIFSTWALYDFFN